MLNSSLKGARRRQYVRALILIFNIKIRIKVNKANLYIVKATWSKLQGDRCQS